ncbi:MAG: hypothetical protein LBL08_03890 [Candidatus Nomurabacteria bacterium]|jgi:flagellar basal body-associated protein FliL|nr:hypothetical protein [Candidatus Nomurabacteria bacterium]
MFKDAGKGIGLGMLAIIIIIVLVIVVAIIGIFGFGWLSRGTAEFRGETGQIEKVQADPNYRIAQYDHFFDLYAEIKADTSRLEILEEELTTTSPSAARVEQVNASVTAVKNSRAQKIARYEADAQKADTAANFLSSDLPYKIPAEYGGEKK